MLATAAMCLELACMLNTSLRYTAQRHAMQRLQPIQVLMTAHALLDDVCGPPVCSLQESQHPTHTSTTV